jgi:ABC-type multidrug transport system fused ATPase/permease subunit
MELLGLAALVPVMQYVQAKGNVADLVADFRWWQMLVGAYAMLDLSVTLEGLLLASMLALILRQGFVYVRLRCQASIKEGITARARARGFRAYVFADAAYQDANGAGRMVNDLTTELDRAVTFLFSSISLIGLSLIFLVYLGALLAISVPLTLIAVAILALAAVAVRGQLRRTEVVGREIVEANQTMSAFLVERLKQVRLIRLAGTEPAETGQMDRLTDRQRGRLVRIFGLLANLEIIVEPIVIGAALAFLYVSVTWLELRLETVGLFLVLLVRLLPVLKEAARMRQSKRGAKASFAAVSDQLEKMHAAAEPVTGTIRFDGLSEGLILEDVGFAYPSRPATRVLDGLSLSVPAGQLTALVGPSGAGKSTVFDMIPRLRHPTSGRIMLDGRNIELFDRTSLRAGIAYAPQTPQLFNVPLVDHIRYGNPDASLEEVVRAAHLANAAGFIEALPHRYDTLAGDGGAHLSGGQRQRLDLARALVRQAPILLLDEPTSQLDAESEALFREALMRIRTETTITMIVIAHRLSTVTMADKIAVMQRGRVVAEGRHEALLRADGWYADAFAKQIGDFSPQAAPRALAAH